MCRAGNLSGNLYAVLLKQRETRRNLPNFALQEARIQQLLAMPSHGQFFEGVKMKSLTPVGNMITHERNTF